MNSPSSPGEQEPLYTAENWRIDESVGFLISQVRARLIAAIDAEMADLDITWAQWSTLMRVATGQASTAADLCRGMGCDTGSMTRMLDRLEEKGLIRRVRSSEDRRMVQIELTDAGRELYPRLPPLTVRVMNRHLKGFSREELDALKGYLRRMLANAEQ